MKGSQSSKFHYFIIINLNEAEDESGSVEDEKHQNKNHHGLRQDELLGPATARSVEPLGLRHLGINLKLIWKSQLKIYEGQIK